MAYPSGNTEHVNAVEEYVLGPENIPFFTTKASPLGPIHVSNFQLTDSGPQPTKSPRHTWSLSMVSFLFRTKAKADKQDSARVFIDTTISSDY